MSTDTPVVRLPPLAAHGKRESWEALLEVAPTLGDHRLLIGGQMVFLHEVELEASGTRPTDDVDVVVDVRVHPESVDSHSDVLCGAGFVQSMPSTERIADRCGRGGATIDVLAPDNLGKRASLALGKAAERLKPPAEPEALSRSGVCHRAARQRNSSRQTPDVGRCAAGQAASRGHGRSISQTTSGASRARARPRLPRGDARPGRSRVSGTHEEGAQRTRRDR